MIIFNLVGILYLVSGVWCAWQAQRSMEFLGYRSDDPHTLGEFITVYGGLQIGIGLAMLLVNIWPQYYSGTLFFATVFSVVLIAMRLLTLVSFGFFAQGNMMAALEMAIAVALLLVFFRHHANMA